MSTSINLFNAFFYKDFEYVILCLLIRDYRNKWIFDFPMRGMLKCSSHRNNVYNTNVVMKP